MNFSEYSKLRKSAQQRLTRLKQAGIMSGVRALPTVAELKKLKNPAAAVKRAEKRAEKIVTEERYTVSGAKTILQERRARRAERQRKRREEKRIYSGLDKKDRGLYRTAKRLGIRSALTKDGFDKFKSYVEQREAQADYSKKYMISEFGEQFEDLIEHGYDPVEVARDFDEYLHDAELMVGEEAGISGYGSADVDRLFDKFVSRLDDDPEYLDWRD